MLGAIDAYLFVGMFFAFAYQTMGSFDDPFFEGGADATVPRVLFFSFTTLTTTGYGNLVPPAGSDSRPRSARCSWVSSSS